VSEETYRTSPYLVNLHVSWTCHIITHLFIDSKGVLFKQFTLSWDFSAEHVNMLNSV